MFEATGVMTRKELEARNEVKWEMYTKKIQIEARVLGDLAMNHIIPVATEYQSIAGVHSGDSMAVYPPQNFDQSVKDQIEDATKKLAVALKCIGIMNIQFIVHKGEVYVLEVNPRASRTVPFLSKITDIKMTQVATQVILGKTLKELGYESGIYPESEMIHVKAPVFSFNKLADVDSLLGPEMKSTVTPPE